MSDRIVLAYSGGSDTSVCIGWPTEQTGQEVVAVAVDVGQGGEDMEVIRSRALDWVLSRRSWWMPRMACRGLRLPAMRANALYMDRYPLSSAPSPGRSSCGTWRRSSVTQGQYRVARLHRQGQRSGGSRSALPTWPRSWPGRAGPRLCVDPRKGDRLRGGKRPADRNEQVLAFTRSIRMSGAVRSRPGFWKTSDRTHRGRLRLYR